MTTKYILSDVDGVLLDWNSEFHSYMTNCDYREWPHHKNKYSLSKRYGTSREEMDRLVSIFNSSQYVSDLPVFRDAKKGLALLDQMGYRVIAVTNVGSSEDTKRLRTKNLLDHFGDVFYDIICLPIGESKYKTLSKWENTGHFWIEDKFSNALDGHSIGLNAVLVDHEYNRDFSTTRFPRVSNETPWEEILKLVVEQHFRD